MPVTWPVMRSGAASPPDGVGRLAAMAADARGLTAVLGGVTAPGLIGWAFKTVGLFVALSRATVTERAASTTETAAGGWAAEAGPGGEPGAASLEGTPVPLAVARPAFAPAFVATLAPPGGGWAVLAA
jgi:hypothetical protein